MEDTGEWGWAADPAEPSHGLQELQEIDELIEDDAAFGAAVRERLQRRAGPYAASQAAAAKRE